MIQQMALQHPLKWTHVVNAVKHELNDAIAQAMESASSDLGDLNWNSVVTLITAMKHYGKRTLTLPESQYLGSLIARAMDSNQIQFRSLKDS